MSQTGRPLLAVDGQTNGVWALYHTGAGVYDAEHGRLLDLLADRIAPVLPNSVTFERARKASLTDPLTGLANRRALEEQLSRELERTSRQHTPTAVVLLDLDGLKSINDVYGHLAGDRAIRAVGVALRSALRRTDLCARYAGDEFVAVLRDCPRDEAVVRARALQAAVGAIYFTVEPSGTVALSISAGVAVCPDDGTTEETLIAAADQRMYEDKQQRKRDGRQPRRPHDAGLRVAGDA